MKILVVDDEKVALTSIKRLLKRRGMRDVTICEHGQEAIAMIKQGDFDIVLLDLLMPEVDGIQVLKATKPFKPHVEFVILTAVDDIDSAVKAIRLGAFDYLVKPADTERLFLSIERAYERRGLRAGLAGSKAGLKQTEVPSEFSAIITGNARMIELLNYAKIMAKSGTPFLITGDSGTGKELLARGIHQASPVARGPFVAVNVAAVPESLFESQFFGHVQGAFTGAERDYPGFFEQANGGTIFLDEVGELPLGLQSKLLRVIEEKTLTRLGTTKSLQVNVRIVSATNVDIDKALQQKQFRLDLMCRLESAHIHLPPLSERTDDIPLLANHFLMLACQRHGKDIEGFSPDAMNVLSQMEFPGNIRSLAQKIETAVLLAETKLIQVESLGEIPKIVPLEKRTICSLKEDHFRHLAFILTHTKGDKQKTAEILGVTIRQVQRLLADMKNDPATRVMIVGL